jgi:hypothetical protein
MTFPNLAMLLLQVYPMESRLDGCRGESWIGATMPVNPYFND